MKSGRLAIRPNKESPDVRIARRGGGLDAERGAPGRAA